MDEEALQEWKGHFDIEDDAIVVLKYLISPTWEEYHLQTLAISFFKHSNRG
jgi:hypothetical protein